MCCQRVSSHGCCTTRPHNWPDPRFIVVHPLVAFLLKLPMAVSLGQALTSLRYKLTRCSCSAVSTSELPLANFSKNRFSYRRVTLVLRLLCACLPESCLATLPRGSSLDTAGHARMWPGLHRGRSVRSLLGPDVGGLLQVPGSWSSAPILHAQPGSTVPPNAEHPRETHWAQRPRGEPFLCLCAFFVGAVATQAKQLSHTSQLYAQFG